MINKAGHQAKMFLFDGQMDVRLMDSGTIMDVSSRQRFLDTCAGVKPEKPFFWESGFWAGAVERWRKEGLPLDADPFEFLGLERFAGTSHNYFPIPPFESKIVEDEGDSELIKDESGQLIRKFKHHFHPGNPGEHAISILRWPVRGRDSWEFVKKRLVPLDTEQMEWALPFLKGEPKSGVVRSGFSGSFEPAAGLATIFYIMTPTYWLIRNLVGFENTAFMLYENPGLLEDIYEYYTWFTEEQLKVIFQQRVPDAVFLNVEAASKAGPFMSPAMYRHFALPSLARIVELCRGKGVTVVAIHSGGNIWRLIPLWLEIGANGLIPIDVGAGMEPEAILKEYGPELILIGGINRRVLEGNRPEIEQEIMAKVPRLLQQGRYIPCGDAHFPITDRVSLDNMRLYVDTLRHAASL